MFRTAIYYSPKRSLAISVHFKQPDFCMTDHEILCRASAFLLNVDPPKPTPPKGKYSHLAVAREQRADRLKRSEYAHQPAGGPKRDVQDLGWLEFAPSTFRPLVHCVAASHVLAPWKWKQYYPMDWVNKVKQEHCTYTLEVYEPGIKEALGKFPLNPYAIHHPEGLDIAVIHLKQEETAVQDLEDLGVEAMYLRDLKNAWQPGEQLMFEGFEVTEDSSMEQEQNEVNNKTPEDTRIFVPYSMPGTLIAASDERYVAKTETPLPEGLCGGPTIDKFGTVAGITEGVIGKNAVNKDLVGAAAFLPNTVVHQFIAWAERLMLMIIVPDEVFMHVVALKATGGYARHDFSNKTNAPKVAEHVKQLSEYHTKEEVDAIMDLVAIQSREAMEIMAAEGGDLDTVSKRIWEKTKTEHPEVYKIMQRGELQKVNKMLKDLKSGPRPQPPWESPYQGKAMQASDSLIDHHRMADTEHEEKDDLASKRA